jgi:hypothetical protein
MDKLNTPTLSDGDAVVTDDAADTTVAPLPLVPEAGEEALSSAPDPLFSNSRELANSPILAPEPVAEIIPESVSSVTDEITQIVEAPAPPVLAETPVEDIAPVLIPMSTPQAEVPTPESTPTPDPLLPNSPIRANSSTPPPSTPAVVQGLPLDNVPIQGESLDTPKPVQATVEPRVVERVVEKIVEKEVIKEVVKEVIKEIPVEKVVEKVVYRDADPRVCPPPTPEEAEAIKRDFLTNLSHEGTVKKHELMLEKMQKILTLFETKPTIMHKDVMELLDTSGTTATRLLTILKKEGKITQQGTRGNGASYTKP